MDFYNFEDSFDLKSNLIGHWMNFNSPILFPWLLKAIFFYYLLNVTIFTAIDEKKEEQQSPLQIFLKDVTEEKSVEIHKHN